MLQLTTSVHRAREWSLGWLLSSLCPPDLPPALCVFPLCLRRRDAAVCWSVASPWAGFGYLCLAASPRDPLLYPPKGQSVWGKLSAKRGWAAGGRRASPAEGSNASALDLPFLCSSAVPASDKWHPRDCGYNRSTQLGYIAAWCFGS